MVFERFESGPWLLVAGLGWLYLTVRNQRREMADLTAQLAALALRRLWRHHTRVRATCRIAYAGFGHRTR